MTTIRQFIDELDRLSPGSTHRISLLTLLVSIHMMATYFVSFWQSRDPLLQPGTVPDPDLYAHPSLLALLTATNLPLSDISALWRTSASLLWSLERQSQGGLVRYLRSYLTVMAERDDKAILPIFRPPIHQCLNRSCGLQILRNPQTATCTFWDLLGAQAARYVHTRCNRCGFAYYPTYYLGSNNMRHYYIGRTDILHPDQSTIVSQELSNEWDLFRLEAWVSSTNLARISNEGRGLIGASKDTARRHWRLTPLTVTTTFYHSALLRHARATGIELVLPNGGLERDRRTAAIRDRNEYYIMHGSPYLDHICNLCAQQYRLPSDLPGTPSRVFRAVGADLCTVGRSACASFGCRNDLLSTRDCFCPAHQDLAERCRVVDSMGERCPNPINGEGQRSCRRPDHAAAEAKFVSLSSQPFSQRCRRPGAFWEPDPTTLADHSNLDTHSGSLVDLDPELLDTTEDPVVGGSRATERDPPSRRTQWGRGRTYGRQMVMGLCGIILHDSTMWSGETVSGLAAILQSMYPDPAELPEGFIYDNGCGLLRHIQKRAALAQAGEIHDDYWTRTRREFFVYVDHFHLRTHSKSDAFCMANCSPDSHPVFRGDDGEQFFNTSIMESTHSWTSGYASICRGMLGYNYEFYLTELCLLRNEYRIAELEAAGMQPRKATRSELRGWGA